MTQITQDRIVADKIHWLARLVLVATGGILLALLVTAALLQPDSRGYGTHQGLGLPPCTIQQLFDIRCPSCGMTTSWAQMVRGHVVRSFQANVGGALLCLAALVAAPWAIGSGIWGRWLGQRISETTALAVIAVVLVATLIDWSVRLFLEF